MTDHDGRLLRLLDEARVLTEREPLASPPRPDEPLAAYLDSLGLLTLVLLVEEEWGIEFSDDELAPENLATLTALTAYLQRLGHV